MRNGESLVACDCCGRQNEVDGIYGLCEEEFKNTVSRTLLNVFKNSFILFKFFLKHWM